MMIVVYILGILLLLPLLFLAFTLLVPLKTAIRGEYWNKRPSGEAEIFWIKRVLGLRFRIHDLNYVYGRVWFLGIPVPFRLPLSKGKKPPKRRAAKKVPEPRFTRKEAPPSSPGIRRRVEGLADMKEPLQEFWRTYGPYIRKIYVRYITISHRSLTANIGLEDPCGTGIAAAAYYNLLVFRKINNIDLRWDFEKPNVDLLLRAKITMKLYGILFTLLQVYRIYKKEKNHESE